MLRVVLIEDQVMFRASLAVLLQTKLGASVIGEFSSGFAFEEAYPALGPVDLILMDIQIPGDDGITLAGRYAEQFPHIRVILLSGVREDYLLHKALQSGADGYLHKDDSTQSLESAIQTVMAGGCYFGYTVQQLRRQLACDPDAFSKVISEKEQEILELIGQGLTNDDASHLVGVSPETIQTHRRNIMRKLGLHNALQLQAYALKKGFTSVSNLR